MNDIFKLFLYSIFYFQIDDLLQPLLFNNFNIFKSDIIIFNPIIQNINIFILSIFSLYSINNIFLFKKKNYTCITLSLIYIKYIMDTIIFHNKVSVQQYEFRRIVMWLFTSPLILKLYCDMNKLKITDVNTQYHIFFVLLQILFFPFKNNKYHIFIMIFLSTVEGFFIYRLYFLQNLKYTKFIMYIWFLFIFVNAIELFNIVGIQDIQVFYLINDIISKFTTLFIINNNDEQLNYIKDDVDLQGISLISAIKETISTFESSNSITNKCKSIIIYTNNKIIDLIPDDKTVVKLELLKKILPLELEENYIMNKNEYTKYNFICILFTDIVSYTELAKKYNDVIIYKLLNEIYTRFDKLIHKYKSLQKIETIGDAYMVVGDLYNNNENKHLIVKDIIELALEYLKEIKKIDTPDNIPLQLRIGINFGSVAVGILGNEIPRLCVIGNAVNISARLQSTADADTIQLSSHIYEIAKELNLDIVYTLKKNVYLKNIGSVNTYNISLISNLQNVSN